MNSLCILFNCSIITVRIASTNVGWFILGNAKVFEVIILPCKVFFFVKLEELEMQNIILSFYSFFLFSESLTTVRIESANGNISINLNKQTCV